MRLVKFGCGPWAALCSCQRRTWVIVSRCMKAVNSPSHSGHKSRCQWLGMTNHFHLVLWPRADGDLSRWMHWLLTTHVRRYLRHYRHSGHVWQARFKAFPIQQDEHFLTVVRYVERNPLRAGLVERAQDWRWSSLRADTQGPSIDPGPVARGAAGLEFV